MVINEGEALSSMGFVVEGELGVTSLAPPPSVKLELIRVGDTKLDSLESQLASMHECPTSTLGSMTTHYLPPAT